MQDSGSAVPLLLFPPGMDTKSLNIFEVEKPAKQSLSASGAESFDGGGELEAFTSGGCNCPDMGFFRVFHIPDFPASITNYNFDGPIIIPIDFKDYRERVHEMKILINGQQTSHAELTSYVSNGQTNWGAVVYFDRMPSGTNQIQLVATLMLSDTTGDNTPFAVLTNRPVSIVVNNQVTFTNWDDLILTTNYTFKAQTKTLDTDWAIEIYDALGFYVNGSSGHTTNGQISWTWDLTDTANNVRDDLDSDPFFDPYITFGTTVSGISGPQSSPSSIRPMPISAHFFPNTGNWLIAYQDRFYADAGPRYSSWQPYYESAMQSMAGGPGLHNIPVISHAIKFGASYTQAERDASWSELQLRLYSPSTRNFYYNGHGSETTIEGDVQVVNTDGYVTGGRRFPGSKAFLDSATVKDLIVFNHGTGFRPYRFVFLDGCQTAVGDWPEAFGTEKTTNVLNFYYSTNNTRHTPPSAFVGWNVSPGGEGWGNVQQNQNFRSYWMSNWSVNWTRAEGELWRSLQDARSGANWITAGQFENAIRVFGYRVMKFKEFNGKADWQWP